MISLDDCEGQELCLLFRTVVVTKCTPSEMYLGTPFFSRSDWDDGGDSLQQSLVQNLIYLHIACHLEMLKNLQNTQKPLNNTFALNFLFLGILINISLGGRHLIYI